MKIGVFTFGFVFGTGFACGMLVVFGLAKTLLQVVA